MVFGSMDTVNAAASDATSTSVTVDTYDSMASNPSMTSQRATAGSIESSSMHGSLTSEGLYNMYFLHISSFSSIFTKGQQSRRVAVVRSSTNFCFKSLLSLTLSKMYRHIWNFAFINYANACFELFVIMLFELIRSLNECANALKN